MPRKGENIYKRKDGRWEGRYVKSRDFYNRAVYGYVYGKTYTETKVKLLSANNEYNSPKRTSTGKYTLSDWLDLWLEKKEHSIKRSTYVKYKNSIDNHIKPNLGSLSVGLIDTRILQKFVTSKLYNKENNTQGLSEKSITDILMIIKNVMKYSKINGEDIQCDFDQIVLKKKYHEMRVLSVDEERRLNAVLFNDFDKFKLGVMICLYTGIRIGELCALQWANISFSDKTLKINKTMQRLQCGDGENSRTKVIISDPKSFSSNRVIPLPDFLVEKLKRYQEHPNSFVLASNNNKFIEPRTMQNHFKKYLTEAHVEDANFHSLRHTFATRCVEAGFEIKSLSEILGHSSVKVTLDKYVHVTMQMKRDNMAKVKLAV